MNILALYEDDLTRDRARHVEAHLCSRLDGSINVRFSWSSLKLWFFPEIMQLATNALKKSDIVLFSIRTGGNLPLAVKSWIAKELAWHNGHQCSLLALVEIKTDAGCFRRPSPACSFLSAVARGCGMDFISQTTETGENIRQFAGNRMQL